VIIALLEDDERRQEGMRALLADYWPAATLRIFDNARDMNAWLPDPLGAVRLICLDHDLGPNRRRDGEAFDPGCGRDVADLLAAHPPSCPVIIHTTNSYAAPGMVAVLEDAGWSVERVVPFNDLDWLHLVWLPAVTGRLEGAA
jgi:hypothetical protein